MEPILEKTPERSGLFPSLPIPLLGSVFFLFPLAHLPLIGFPIYLCEGVLFLAFALLLFQKSTGLFLASFQKLLREERIFFILLGIFAAGILLSWGFNGHAWQTLGKLKSFYLVPFLFLFALLLCVQTFRELRFLLGTWFFGSLSAALAALLAASEGIFLYDGRLSGPYQSANYLALLLAPGLLIAWFFFLTSRSRWRKGLAFFASLILSAALFLTHSYAAFMAVGISLVVGILLLAKNIGRKNFLIGALGISLVMGSLVSFESGAEKWQQLITLDSRSSLASRLIIWQVAVDIATDYPLLGIGTGNFQAIYLAYQKDYPPYLEWAVPTPHNLFLHFFLEGGILTLFAWVGIIGFLGARFLALQRAGAYAEEKMATTLFCGLLFLFYLTYGLIDTPYMKNDLALAVWGSIGLLLVSLRIKS